jgi:SAM-dependent methyltransferase
MPHNSLRGFGSREVRDGLIGKASPLEFSPVSRFYVQVRRDTLQRILRRSTAVREARIRAKKYSIQMTDRSNGYERVAAEFLAGRGSARTRAKGIGVTAVREWARTLPSGAAVIDLGCGPGFPITEVLVSGGLNVYAVDASPSFVEAFRRNLPGIPVACEAVQDSTFFDRTFDAVIACGLIFLLPAEEQQRLIHRVADILVPGGRLLFTSCAEPVVWNDAMTGLELRSLGAVEYRSQLTAVGLSVIREYEDEGENHYFDALKGAPR